MFKPVFALVLTLSLTACGGAGSTAGAGIVPVSGQSSSALSGGLMPASSGTVGAGYIECDTAANIAAGNDCNGYANFSNGAFAFTAIAATSSGTPIAAQAGSGGALGFANGAYRVAESASDSPAIVAVSGGPWAAPGAVLSGPGGSYGNRFFVQCVRRGTASLELELISGADASALPLATGAFPANTTTVNCSASGAVTVF
ncbi:MAG TPA: hypothetical protein VFF00_02595 [Candidatus Elarobacter sp.]|nr:hypothetical protein [Candidatus Elarobacter sp.]